MDTPTTRIKFDKFTASHVPQVAKLHLEGIKGGFITSLGINFITALYDAIAQSDSNFGLVAHEDSKILGFIIFSTNLKQLYKSIILKKGLWFVLLLANRMCSFRQIKNIVETLRYPKRIRSLNIPSTGLMSIAVSYETRGKGLATMLIQKGFSECLKRDIDRVRVLVGTDNVPANALYRKCGFKKSYSIYNHGILCNLYVIDFETGRNRTTSDMLSAAQTFKYQENDYAEFLREAGYFVITANNIDWFQYHSFITPAYLPHRCPSISEDMAKEALMLSRRTFARWETKFGTTENSPWWYVLKRGNWNIEDITDKKKRRIIEQGRKNFSFRSLTLQEVLNGCPEIDRLATQRHKGKINVETSRFYQVRLKAAEKMPGILEYIGCFYGNKLVSFSESYISDNAVWLANIRHDPVFLEKYSNYGLMDWILNYYLNEKKMLYVLDGPRGLCHKPNFQDDLIRIFGFTREYVILNVVYSPKVAFFIAVLYPLRCFVCYLSDKCQCKFLNMVSAMLMQEHIRRTCRKDISAI